MEVDQNDHIENLQDDKLDQNIGRNFHNLAHHPAMVCFRFINFNRN